MKNRHRLAGLRSLGACGLALVVCAPAAQPGTMAAEHGGPMPADPAPDPYVAAADDAYRFVVVADSRGEERGVNESALSGVFDAIMGLDPQPEFVFFVGDLVHGKAGPDELQRELAAWARIIDPRFDVDRVYPVFGGHERLRDLASPERAWSGFKEFFNPAKQAGREGGEPQMKCRYFKAKFNPAKDRTSYSRTVYYCDYGSDRFFVLNNDCIPEGHSVTGATATGDGCVQHELGCAQFNWLKHHLVGNGKRHNFFFHHEPAFATGAHDSGGVYNNRNCPNPLRQGLGVRKSARNDYLRLLGFHNGSAIFSGHEHQYTWRSITDGFVHEGRNNPGGVDRSLVLLIKADPARQQAGPAVAYSFEGARERGKRGWAPSLRLWWSSAVGAPDWKGRIVSGADDAEQLRRSGAAVRVHEPALGLMRDRSNREQSFVALRWTNVPIPPGATIQRAHIRFRARESSASGPRVKIKGEAAPFAFPFSQCRSDLQRRRRGRESVVWEIGGWKRNKVYDTPDLAPIIQELLDDQGYATAFGGEIPEIKTGSSGAPWMDGSCEQFMGRIQAEVIRLEDNPGQGMPYHYAIVDVRDGGFSVSVRDADGVEFPVPPGY